MNINLKLPDELQKRIEEAANDRLKHRVEEILEEDTELDKLLKDTIKGQLKNTALRILQDQTTRTLMTQKINPIIYRTLGLQDIASGFNVKKAKSFDIVCEDKKYLPTYANETDACMDLKIKLENPNCYFLKPNEVASFSTGIKASVPEDYMMLIFPRSSTGFKLHCILANTTGIIDAGYRDEIKLSLYNFGKETVCLQDAQRVAQFVIIPRPKLELNLVQDDESFRQGDRGGGIGSTGA